MLSLGADREKDFVDGKREAQDLSITRPTVQLASGTVGRVVPFPNSACAS